MASTFPVSFTLPSASLFSFFPPSSEPAFLAPALPGSIPAAPPVGIQENIYQAALDPKVPITIAAVYAITVKALNAYNKSTGKKPWAISQTKAFRAFVVAHNIFLAVYSAWTWWGMFGAMRRSMASPAGPGGLAAFTDSVCRLHGPPGLGRAVYYGEEAGGWQTHSVPSESSTPSAFESGRIWNEGLAFYGWIFYLSKFYEVLDTFIILAKGKLSSTLQTYHHAGAMMCMWAGMRFMSPPIWMFVLVNSGIHAIMYTYYTLTAFNVRVPVFIKRTLTSMQITQFLVGASYAMLHSFVSYTVPVLEANSQEQAKSAPSPAHTASINATASAVPTLLDNIRALVFGGASAVAPAAVTASSVAAADPVTGSFVEYVTTPCITTTGQTFAIWLNVVYLAPLTYLFMMFFVSSYLKRSTADYKNKTVSNAGGRSGGNHVAKLAHRRLSNEVAHAEKAGWDAARSVEREVYGQDGTEEAVVTDGQMPTKMNGNGSMRTTRRKA